VIELSFRPDRRSDVALHRQLASHLAELIDAGRVAEGTKLPASRELARALGLARNTVARAYEELVVQERLRAHVGQGTFVAPRSRAGDRDRAAAAGDARRAGGRSLAWSGLLSRRVRGLRIPGLRFGDLAARFAYDFRAGRVDLGSLPAKDLRWAFAQATTPARLRALADHRDPAGWPPLRTEIARWLVARGIACDADDVLVVAGAQQAIDVVARVLVDPGDAVVVEQPGYFGAPFALAANGAEVVGIGVDEHGLRTDELARLLAVRSVKLVVATPATQCPTGAVLSDERRGHLLELADRHQTPILEDDYDAELRYSGPVQPALRAADASGQVIYAGTFSKVVFPSLRVGYLVAAPALRRKLVLARTAADLGTGVVEQAALATLLRTRGLERHLQRLRKVYGARLAAMLDALARAMPAGTRFSRPRGGHVVWVTLPPDVDGDRLYQAARERGVAYERGESFFLDGGGAQHLALSFTTLEPARIAAGIDRLGEVALACRRSRAVSRATAATRRTRSAPPRSPRATARERVATARRKEAR
jgi:GntR family transcriptional regulator/MocR family aminotransferase